MISFSMLGGYGRLGNQLFQIASTLGIGKGNGQSVVFPFWQYQRLIKGKLPYGLLPVNHKKFIYLNSRFTEVKLDYYSNYDLEGYFQSYKYFEDIRLEIRELFSPLALINEPISDVAVHVRRGDYLALSHVHPALGMDYYNRAMEMFPDQFFTVFSDDLYWCKQNFDTKRCLFIAPQTTHLGEIQDLFYMAMHKNIIIANSSFSWWGAYLSNAHKIISPSVWALNEPPDVMEDRIPERWTRI